MPRRHRPEQLSIARLTHPLPPLPLPLPLDDIVSRPSPKEAPLPPYRDEVEEAAVAASVPESQPPGYEPMYDYLRTRQNSNPPQCVAFPPIQGPTLSMPIRPTIFLHEPPYRDEPFIVTIDPSQPPPPSYNELYSQQQEHLQQQEQMQQLIREFDDNGTRAERSEEVFKWFISMTLIALTVVAVGTAFNWGAGCDHLGHC